MTKTELLQKCGMVDGQLIQSNLGFIDILGVKDSVVTLGILATGSVFTESAESVISKLSAVCAKREV